MQLSRAFLALLVLLLTAPCSLAQVSSSSSSDFPGADSSSSSFFDVGSSSSSSSAIVDVSSSSSGGGSSSSGSPAFGFSSSSSSSSAAVVPPSSASLAVDITFPNSLVTQGVAGVGWLIDINLSALTASANALLTPPAFIPGFRNGAGTPFSSVHSPGVNPDAPGLVVLLSTTSNNSVTLLGPNTNLAGLFEVNAPAVSSAGLNEFRLVWWVGATAFGTNVNSTLTVFVVSGTAPAFLTTSPEATPNLISNIATTLFSISGPTSLTASTSTFTGPSPADPSAVNVKVFTPAPGDTIGVDAFNFVVDLRAITTSPQFNPLLSEGAGYFPRFANASNATQVHVGAFLTAPGVVVLLNTTTLGTGANTNLAGLFQINALNTLATANGEVNEIWMDWQAGKPAFGSGPCQLTVFILNDTAPTSISGAPEEQPGLISNIVTVDFFISPPAGASGSGSSSTGGAVIPPPTSGALNVDITFPNSLVTQGVAGVGWLIDINLSALTASANALLTPPAFIPGFRNGAGTPFSSVHSPGVNPDAPGLVVLLSTTSNNSVTLLGPNTNLAGLFEVNAPAVSSAGLNEFRLVWWVGATAFGTNVNSTLTVFVVSGTAPAFLTTSPEATPNLISNIATTLFSISGPTSLTASTSTFTGPSPADPSAVNVKVFTPAPGDTIGVDAFNFVVDLRAITTSPQFNPLLSEGAGYFPRFANASNATQVHVGAFLTAPGVVVLLNTTTLGTGANTNLAGLFQINALNTLATANGEVNEIWMDWQAGKPAFGSGPCQLTVFILNDTAPTSISGAPEEQPGLISNIVTVDFFISPPAGASGSGSSSTGGAVIPPPTSGALNVDITFPNSLVTQGVAGVGWLIDINLSALTASANALLTPPAFIPGFRNGAGTPFSSVHSPGVNPDAPGLVVLLSTTSNNSVTLLGPNTNLAGLFEVNAPAVSSAGLNEFRLVWWVGATAFGTNVNSTLTVFVVSGTAPAFLTTSPEATPNLISNIATTLFSISGPTSLTASTSTFTGPSPADPSAVNVKVFTPAPGDTIGVDAFNFVVDLRAITTSPQFNPLLSEGAGYFPRFANASNATQVHVGAFLTAPGVVVLLNTTTLGTGANTNLAGLFQINALNTLATANGEVNEIWMDWQAGKPAFGSGPCQLTVFILNDTAPTSISGAPEEQPGLISNIVTVDFFISPPAGASGSGSSSTGGAVIPPPTSGALNVDITFPNSLVTQGVAGVGWLIDINLSALTASANALLTPPAFIPGFRNGAGTPFSSVHSPGVNPDAPGLVVLLSTTSNNSVTLLGPNTNLAGLFEVNAPAVSSAGLNEFRLVWWVGATAFGTNVNSTLTVFVVSGTAPAFLTTSPEATPNLISNIATTLFSISGPTSLTASTSTFTGPSPADPSAVNVKVFTPAPGDTIGVDAFNFVVDLRAITTSPQFNPLLSEGAGYFPRFANASNATQVHVGAFLTAPGVVVLLNTTTLGTGANTNLAGLFQINALNTLATANGEVNEIWMDWQAGKPAFGSGPCQLTVFILNDTAPTSISGAPEEQPGLISNIVTVDFFISPPAGSTISTSSSSTGTSTTPTNSALTSASVQWIVSTFIASIILAFVL